MQEFPLTSYHSFTCPNCEHNFRVIWPGPLPSYYHRYSRVKFNCPDCGEVSEPYAYMIDTILCASEPGLPSVQPLSISRRDPNPDPDANIKWRQNIFIRRAARFKTMYGN